MCGLGQPCNPKVPVFDELRMKLKNQIFLQIAPLKGNIVPVYPVSPCNIILNKLYLVVN